jgi:hypothetical protein
VVEILELFSSLEINFIFYFIFSHLSFMMKVLFTFGALILFTIGPSSTHAILVDIKEKDYAPRCVTFKEEINVFVT